VSSLDIHHMTVSFDETVVLDDVSLSLAHGETVALLGPSGSGKSTLLRAVAGIIAPDSGTVEIDGIDVTHTPTYRRGVGMVFQDNQLFPHRSTIDNVGFGLKMAGIERSERNERSALWLERVGLAGFADRRVTDLSGGEAKRVALARTLVAEPSIVLLDEPLTGLDRELHDHLANELVGILTTAAATTLLVTHDPEEAALVAIRSVQLEDLR
jgi:thiamine transport system ATP-binding protein